MKQLEVQGSLMARNPKAVCWFENRRQPHTRQLRNQAENKKSVKNVFGSLVGCSYTGRHSKGRCVCVIVTPFWNRCSDPSAFDAKSEGPDWRPVGQTLNMTTVLAESRMVQHVSPQSDAHVYTHTHTLHACTHRVLLCVHTHTTQLRDATSHFSRPRTNNETRDVSHFAKFSVGFGAPPIFNPRNQS